MSAKETIQTDSFMNRKEIAASLARDKAEIRRRELCMPDGRRITVSGSNDATGEVYVIEVDGKDNRTMATMSSDDFDALVREAEQARKDVHTAADGAEVAVPATNGDVSIDSTAPKEAPVAVTQEDNGVDVPVQVNHTLKPTPPAASPSTREGKEDFDVLYNRLAGNLGIETDASPKKRETGRTYDLDGEVAAAQARLDRKAEQLEREALEKLGISPQPQAEGAAEPTSEITESDVTPELPPNNPNAPATPEQRERLRAIIENGTSGSPASETPDEPPVNRIFRQAREEHAREQRNAHVQAETARIRGEVDGEHGERLRSAMARYAELKATSETKGQGMWFMRGKTRRETLLKAAEEELLQAKIDYEKAVIIKKNDAGLYEGDNAAKNQQSADELFNAIRGLDGETRKATNDVLDRRMEERGVFRRAVAKVGAFLTGGGKVSQAAKSVGSGLALGFGMGFAGLGVPVISVIGAAAGFGVRKIATDANLDRIRAENVDVNGNAVTVVSDEAFDRFKQAMRTSTQNIEHQAALLGNDILRASRERGYEQVARAKRKAGATALGFVLGFGGGMLAGDWAHGLAHQAGGAVSPTGKRAVAQGMEKMAVKADASTGGFEFAHGADKITSGEGWLHKFRSMVNTAEQAKELFSDHKLMNDLVKAGAAYVDNSARIGGYGINMPASGHLSAEAMEIIGKAMAAKGI